MTRGNATQGLGVTVRPCERDAASCVCELATILILFVQTDPVPFYFQLVENKLVLFLLSVAMTTQPLFFFFGGSREVKEKQIRPLLLGTFSRFLTFIIQAKVILSLKGGQISVVFCILLIFCLFLINADDTRNLNGYCVLNRAATNDYFKYFYFFIL